MKKVDFKEVKVETIDGGVQLADLRQVIGNTLFYKSQDLAGSELGKRIYFSVGEVELNDEEAKMVLTASGVLSYVYRHALETTLKTEEK